MVVAGAVVVATAPPSPGGRRSAAAVVVVAVAVVVAVKPPLSRSNPGRSHKVGVEPQPCLVTKSVKFRFGELSFGASGSKSRNLGMVLDPVFLHKHKLGQI